MAVNESHFGELLRKRGAVRDYPLWALRDLHLRSNYESEMTPPGNITYVYLFAAIAFLVLCIASFNFINLSTARSANRAREVGLRKVFGAYRKHLVRQFLSESIVVSLIALVFGVALVQLVLPLFNQHHRQRIRCLAVVEPYFRSRDTGSRSVDRNCGRKFSCIYFIRISSRSRPFGANWAPEQKKPCSAKPWLCCSSPSPSS